MTEVSGKISSAPTRRSPNPFKAGSIQSKLLVMLLLASILSAAVVGFFAYRTGTNALREEAFERLTDVRLERTRALNSYIAGIKADSIVTSQGIAIFALQEFDAAFQELDDVKVTSKQRAEVRDYYANFFVPNLQKVSQGVVQTDSFIPRDDRRTYLQSRYTAVSDSFDTKLKLDDGGDDSRWTEANKVFQPYFRALVNSRGLDDLMLINLDGDIVYTAFKGVDLGSNVLTGDFRGGGLEEVYTKAVKSNSRDFVVGSDLELYQPSYNRAAGFIASPIADLDSKIIGVAVTQVPVDGISSLMTGSSDAGEVVGLGETGETYLGGADGTMRSNSRVLIEDPGEYERSAIQRGTNPDIVKTVLTAESTVNLQPIKSKAQEAALNGEEGTIITTDYLGKEVLDSYGPAGIPGLNWTVIAKMNTSEAFEPVNDFARNILLATAAIVLLVSAASLFMARVFTTPLNKLLEGVRAVAGGDLGAQVVTETKDEFGDLGRAFNDMSSSLASKDELLQAQQAENERLLGSLMPAPVMKRYQGGETAISDEHKNVSVAFTEIEGFDAFASRLPAAEALELLNHLSRECDEAAKHAGVEKVRSDGTGYVASSGLVVQRVDHVRRVVDFALDVADVAERFNGRNEAKLTMRAGINTGDVRSGLVGRGDVVYNLWGDAVNLAYRIRSVAGDAGIYITDDVKEQLGGGYAFERVGSVTDDGTERHVWRVQRGVSGS